MSANPSRCRGLSLIELMVAMAISLIAMLAITQVYVVSEEQKRTTVSGGEAQQNGILALQFIQQDLLMAGYGIIGAGALGCKINATSDSGTTSFTLKLVPAFIRKDHPVAETDSITVMYSKANGASGPPAVIRTNHPASAANFQLDNTIGFAQNDFIVAYQSGKPCTLMKTTNDPTVSNSNTLVHNDGGGGGYNVASNTNFPQNTIPGDPAIPASPAYTTSGYDAGSTIFNLGQPVNVRYQISNNKLVQVDLFNNNATVELAEGIVAMYAEYSIDTASPNPAVQATPTVANGDALVNAFVRPIAGADGYPNHAVFGTANATQIAAGWGRVYAIRVAIVSRSSLREKTQVSPATLPYWPGGPDFTVPDRNYRYKVYHTIVPLRNMVWRRPGI